MLLLLLLLLVKFRTRIVFLNAQLELLLEFFKVDRFDYLLLIMEFIEYSPSNLRSI